LSLEAKLTPEDFRFTPPDVPEDQIHDLLWKNYGVQGVLHRLAGERDQNIRVSTARGDTYVLKIAGPRERVETLDFQTAALDHIRREDANLGVPRVIATVNGELRTAVESNEGPALQARLLTHVPGVPLDSAEHLTEATLRSVGQLIGRVLRSLERFEAPVSQDFLPWDVLNGLVVRDEFREHNLPDCLEDLCAPFLDRFATESLPQLRALPAQVIHNDLHSGNILCDPQDTARLTGCIDFGDMVCRPALMELASAFGEFAGSFSDPLNDFRTVLEGVREHVELPDDLLGLLYDASLARAILCAQIATFRIREANVDPEIEASHLPWAIASVKAISAVGRDTFSSNLSQAA